MLYLDASALVKLVVEEPESEALEAWLEGRGHIASCALVRTEVPRAVRPHGEDHLARARSLVEDVELLGLAFELLDRAADLQPPLRSLDAIHLSAALELGDDLDAVVTYDARMADAARALGLPLAQPA